MMNEYNKTNEHKHFVQNIYDGVVVENDDEYQSGIIKVRIPNLDKNTEVEQLPNAHPLMGLHFHNIPRENEMVRVILSVDYNADGAFNKEKRYYFPAVISQPQKIENDPYYYTASASENNGFVQRETPISQIPTAIGVFPSKDDVALIGRDNADIQLKKNEVVLRAGKHLEGQPTIFNTKNISYIQLKYKKDYLETIIEGDKKRVLKQIPPKHNISLVVNAQNEVLIKVIRLSDNVVEETFKNAYNSNDDLLRETNKQLKTLKNQFPFWTLNTNSDLFNNQERIFPNNTVLVTEEVERPQTQEEKQNNESVVNIVADRINLLSHKDNTRELNNPDGLISANTQAEIHKNASPMVRGDSLAEFLNLMRLSIITHSHGYNGLESLKTDVITKLENFDINSILNEYVRH